MTDRVHTVALMAATLEAGDRADSDLASVDLPAHYVDRALELYREAEKQVREADNEVVQCGAIGPLGHDGIGTDCSPICSLPKNHDGDHRRYKGLPWSEP